MQKKTLPTKKKYIKGKIVEKKPTNHTLTVPRSTSNIPSYVTSIESNKALAGAFLLLKAASDKKDPSAKSLNYDDLINLIIWWKGADTAKKNSTRILKELSEWMRFSPAEPFKKEDLLESLHERLRKGGNYNTPLTTQVKKDLRQIIHNIEKDPSPIVYMYPATLFIPPDGKRGIQKNLVVANMCTITRVVDGNPTFEAIPFACAQLLQGFDITIDPDFLKEITPKNKNDVCVNILVELRKIRKKYEEDGKVFIGKEITTKTAFCEKIGLGQITPIKERNRILKENCDKIEEKTNGMILFHFTKFSDDLEIEFK